METITPIQSFDVPTSIHYVGSYPAPSAEAALADMLTEETRDKLYCVSDGETDRPNWVVDQINSYRHNPAFRLVEDGNWEHYEDCPEFEIATNDLTSADIDLHYYDHAEQSWPAFMAARERVKRPDLKFQVGIPTGYDMSLFTLGIERGMDPAAIEAFTKATVEQIEQIHNSGFGDQVVYQLETPASLSVALEFDDRAVRQGLAKSVANLVDRSPDGTRFGIHLCVGDLNNVARKQPSDRRASVELANAIAADDAWQRHELAYIHEPIAAGHDGLPQLNERMYVHLRDLKLPEGTRYIAGMVHEEQPLDDQRAVLNMIRRYLPQSQRLGIAAACGLGRRSSSKAHEVTRRMNDLTT